MKDEVQHSQDIRKRRKDFEKELQNATTERESINQWLLTAKQDQQTKNDMENEIARLQ